MPSEKIRFEIVKGETEHISFNGRRVRRPTVLIRVGGLSLSKKAFLLGLALVLCQIFDGILTYVGLSLLGVDMEGNAFLRQLIHSYGVAPTLVVAKGVAVGLAVLLTLNAHRRKWVRPIILCLVVIYLCLALVPWIMTLHQAGALPFQAPS